uniref:BTB domain-containing protein n=1 Tax=Caenorhabditis tropicalis TaxID=1561998 RepID=A0A1I7TGR5_9PELO
MIHSSNGDSLASETLANDPLATDLKENELHFSEEKEHYGIPWKIKVYRETGYLSFFLHCLYPKKEGTWTIQVSSDLKLLSMAGKSKVVPLNDCLYSSNSQYSGWGNDEFIKWEEMEKDYMIDGDVIIEAHVRIIEMSGTNKRKLRTWDESAKRFSDVVLIVNDEKFYVSKLYLASQSSYFEALFSDKFEESKKSEITLNDIEPIDFQKFLECLYCENCVNDDTVEGILQLADMYDAKVAIQRCVEFLKKDSMFTLKEKLRMATQYKLEVFKMDCLSKINTVPEIRSVMSNDMDKMDPSVVKFLLKKALELHN